MFIPARDLDSQSKILLLTKNKLFRATKVEVEQRTR